MNTNAPYDINKATLPKEETSNAVNHWGDKEQTNSLVLVAFDAKARKADKDSTYPRHRQGAGFAEVVTARFWMGRSSSASVVYCSIWVRTRDGRWFGGKGSAGGFGYHKESAALDDAIRSAGIKLGASCHGCGEGAMNVALRAIAKAAGYGRCPQTII